MTPPVDEFSSSAVALAPPVIVGVGEILWDVFPDGPRFGGAPANFACSAAGLAGSAAHVCMASAVGQDEFGTQARRELTQRGVDATCVAQLEQSTGRVDVTINAAGVASYRFAADAAWDRFDWSSDLERLSSQASAVCFGTLGSRSEISQSTIRRFVGATQPDCLRVFDVNLRAPFWSNSLLRELLPLANVLKCNEDELPVIAGLFGLSGSDRDLLSDLQERFSLRLAAVTRGAGGALLLGSAGEFSDLPAIETVVVDTVGAGDSFTAALTLGLLSEQPLAETHNWARRVSSFVCSQAGATPTLPTEFRWRIV